MYYKLLENDLAFDNKGMTGQIFIRVKHEKGVSHNFQDLINSKADIFTTGLVWFEVVFKSRYVLNFYNSPSLEKVNSGCLKSNLTMHFKQCKQWFEYQHLLLLLNI
jgi:hypothetical protein